MAVVQLSLNEICRGCLSRESLEPLSKGRRIETLAECVNLQVSLSDGLPSKICSDCWDQCAKWDLFRQQFRKNDATLRGLLMFTVPERAGSGVVDKEPEDMIIDEDEIVYEKDPNDGVTADLLETAGSSLQLSVDEGEGEEEEVEETAASHSSPTPQPAERPNRTSARNKVVPEKCPPTDTLDPPASVANSSSNSRAIHLSCKHCDKKFRKPAILAAHEREHEGKKPFVCNICSKEFNGRLAMRNHSFTHSSAKYSCPECERSFSYPQLMVEHRKRMHMGPEKTFPCTVCQKEFNRAQTLQVHMLTHTTEKPVVCNVCQARFKSELYLKIHQVRHSDVRNFECSADGCGKSFYTKSELNFHNRNVHLDDKPHACTECEKRFAKRSQLENHMQTHSSSERKFKCGECPLSFASAKRLNSHTKNAHTPEKYECEQCQKEFRLKHSYITHLKTHTKK